MGEHTPALNLVERLLSTDGDPYFHMTGGVPEWLADNWALREEAAAVIADLHAALEPFVTVLENDIGQDETDEDKYTPISHNRAPHITVGHLRAAAAAIAKAEGSGQ